MYKYGIVAIGYSNQAGMKRLLNALSTAEYSTSEVCLIISIDKADNNEVEKIANEFIWEYGEKKVVTFPQRLGLRDHVLHCGDYLNLYDLDAIAVFEDDTLPACSFFHFMTQVTEKYMNRDDIAGISLYSNWINNSNQSFIPMASGYDNYFVQSAQSWGQVWFRRQWNAFRDWYKKQEKMESCYWIPKEVTAWPESSWKKYHIKYCIENKKYFVYPYVSYTTCFADIGEHFKKNTNMLQVPIANKISHAMKFAELEDDDAVRYDAFFENQDLYKYCNINKDELTVDLYGNHIETSKRYLLSKKVLPYNVINSWGDRMVPHEMNLIYNVPGDDIFLYDLGVKSETIPLPESKCQNSKMQVYFEILDKWMKMEEDGCKLQDYFMERKWYHVAIYGKSKIGRHLYTKLKDTPIHVDYFIDRNADTGEQDIETITLGEQLPFVDVIIVTPVMEFERIENSLRYSAIKNIVPVNCIFGA